MKNAKYYFPALLAAGSSLAQEAESFLAGGAVFKTPSKIIIPTGASATLTSDALIRVEELRIDGELFTEGHSLLLEVRNLVFGPGACIRSFSKAAPDSTMVGSPGAAQPTSADSKVVGAKGIDGMAGNKGDSGPVDPGADGMKQPGEIRIIASELSGVPCVAGMGQDGGKGAEGGKGGRGGDGGKGGPGKIDHYLFWTDEIDPGVGGTGGNGGLGGEGGVGGQGGDAVPVQLILGRANPELDLSLIKSVPGIGGPGGLPGEGGEAGTPGPGGNHKKRDWYAFFGDDTAEPEAGKAATKGSPSAGGPTGASGRSESIQRVINDLTTIEEARRRLLMVWYRANWSRELVLMVQNTLVLAAQVQQPRDQVEDTPEWIARLQKSKASRLEKMTSNWRKYFIDPVEKNIEALGNRSGLEFEQALKVGKSVVELLNTQEEAELRSQLGALLNGEEGAMPLYSLRLSQALRECKHYTEQKLQEIERTSAKNVLQLLQLRVPVCESQENYLETENLEKQYVFGMPLETEVDPAPLRDFLVKEKWLLETTQLQKWQIFDVKWIRTLKEMIFGVSAFAQNAYTLRIDNKILSYEDILESFPERRFSEKHGQLMSLQPHEQKSLTIDNFGWHLRAMVMRLEALREKGF